MGSIPYTYQPLDIGRKEIRLFILLPGAYDDPIRGMIRHTPLPTMEYLPDKRLSLKDLENSLIPPWMVFETAEHRYLFEDVDKDETFWVHPDPHFDQSLYAGYGKDPDPKYEPKYEALSYVWGSPQDPEILSVQDDACSLGTISITRNLAIALRHLRYQQSMRPIWIDAICINQNDVTDKNYQVPRMRFIYTSAERTIFWLGPASESSSHALSILKHLGEQVEITVTGTRLRSPEAEHPRWYRSGQATLPYSHDTWQALGNLLKRSWFERLWIIQEARLSNRFALVQCGSEKLSWGLFRPPLIYEYSDFFRLVAGARRKGCSNPRDRVYGILSLIPQNIADSVDVNYSYSAAYVFTNSFLAWLKQTSRLDLLLYVSTERVTAHLPTWVPDWACLPNLGQSKIFQGFHSGFSAAQAQDHSAQLLNVMGLKIATVKTINAPFTNDLAQVSNIIRQFNLPSLEASKPIDGYSSLDRLVLAFSMGYLKDFYPDLEAYGSLEDWKKWLERLASNPTDVLDDGSAWKIQYLLSMIQGRMLVTSRDGYFGLACASTQPGDEICVILGCYMAIVLRQHSAESKPVNNEYEVIGDCCIGGATYGESLLGPIPAPWRLQMIQDNIGFRTPQFVNTETEARTTDDPRLGSVPRDWEELEAVRLPEDPAVFKRFRNKTSGEVIDSDPRMFPEALKQRGVKLETFTLV